MACWISDNTDLRDVHQSLALEAKSLLKADLENITLENVQTCCVIANLCEWSCNRSSEALFFRKHQPQLCAPVGPFPQSQNSPVMEGIAIGMAEIMNLSTPDLSSPIAERETKRRVFWTLFAADRWFSSGLHLARLLDDFQKSVELPMDESIFHSLDPADMTLSTPWKPGLWAHMVGLHKLFGPILDLNRRCAQGDILDNEREVLVADIANSLASWETMIPSGDKITEENFQFHRQRGTGGPLIALHLAHNYYSLLLYFQYLSHDHPLSSSEQTYMKRCKEHAEVYSRLVKLSREHSGCEALFPTVSHMTVVSSSVLLHTLLFGEKEEVANARATLNSNFEALVEFKQYWPELTAQMVSSRPQRSQSYLVYCPVSREYLF
jgi:hypothetical protein